MPSVRRTCPGQIGNREPPLQAGEVEVGSEDDVSHRASVGPIGRQDRAPIAPSKLIATSRPIRGSGRFAAATPRRQPRSPTPKSAVRFRSRQHRNTAPFAGIGRENGYPKRRPSTRRPASHSPRSSERQRRRDSITAPAYITPPRHQDAICGWDVPDPPSGNASRFLKNGPRTIWSGAGRVKRKRFATKCGDLRISRWSNGRAIDGIAR